METTLHHARSTARAVGEKARSLPLPGGAGTTRAAPLTVASAEAALSGRDGRLQRRQRQPRSGKQIIENGAGFLGAVALRLHAGVAA
jgi:hypothetical protein